MPIQPPSAERRTLTPREHEVLNAVVVQYIHTGEPVGSRLIAKSNSEGLCSASIRGIMSELEEAGYIAHPHASAGRMPTDQGIRHYLDRLDLRPGLSEDERRSLAESVYAGGGLPSLLSRCTHLLAVASREICVGTALDLSATTFRHVDLLKLNEERLLVVFITAAGIVSQHVLVVEVPESQGELDRHARYLNEQLSGRTLVEVRDRIVALMSDERVQYDALLRRALEIGAQYFSQGDAADGEVVVDGAEHVLRRPEQGEFDRTKALMAALDDKRRVLMLLNTFMDRQGVSAAIGSETNDPELAGCSVVAANYGFDDARLGTLGIIGPTRMEYHRAMALVEHVAELLGAALQGPRS